MRIEKDLNVYWITEAESGWDYFEKESGKNSLFPPYLNIRSFSPM